MKPCPAQRLETSCQRQPLDAPGIPFIDGELSSGLNADGQLEVAVIEHLRVKVPAAARSAWLEAEQLTWEPWLAQQQGFLGRHLHWDQEREEGQLLIRWASRQQWHAIPRAEIEAVQERFERIAHACLVRQGLLAPISDEERAMGSSAASELPAAGVPAANPFPLVFAGELGRQP